jgi:predicted ester cyclase
VEHREDLNDRWPRPVWPGPFLTAFNNADEAASAVATGSLYRDLWTAALFLLAFPRPPSYWRPPGSTGDIAMVKTDLSDVYRNYIACLNKQEWQKLERFVHDEVYYNGQRIGRLGYREMLERDFYKIPDLYFDIQLLIADPPHIASRLRFDCSPKGEFLGLQVNGKKVSFTENVFYEFRRGRIEQVWSVIDKAAIEAQL